MENDVNNDEVSRDSSSDSDTSMQDDTEEEILMLMKEVFFGFCIFM